VKAFIVMKDPAKATPEMAKALIGIARSI